MSTIIITPKFALFNYSSATSLNFFENAKKIFKGEYKPMETIVSALIGAVVAIVTCLINNNVQRTKEQHAIEMQIAAVNANYDKSTALIQAQINELSERVNKHNNLIERMYKCEDRLNIVEHDIQDIRDDMK